MFEFLNKIQARVESSLDQTKVPRPFTLEWVLRYFSAAYGFMVRLRLFLYEKNILKQKSLPCFVISVGNVVVGGTGKTPMTIYLAKILKEMGKKPVVISRGYKGNYKKDVLVVSDGRCLLSSAEECGDEPYMMAQKKEFPVVVGKDRFKAGKKAIREFNPDVIILDDGFQHLKLKRDLDIVLFDFLNPIGNGLLLPAGRLREPLAIAVKRAHGLIFTRCQDEGTLNGKTQEIQENTPVPLKIFKANLSFRTRHVPFISRLEPSGEKEQIFEKMELESLKGKKALLFSGIATNSSFYQTMVECGVNIVHHLEFQDHYRYKRSDFEKINSKAVELGAQIILTTEKDWVKTGLDIKWKKEVAIVGIRIEFESPVDFQNFLKQRLN